jgi:hypothetical protein
MNKILMGILFSIVLLSSSLVQAQEASIIPPTNAWLKVTTSNGTVSAKNYTGNLKIITSGITVTSSQHGQALYLNVPSTGKQGTYNKTLANNVVINKGGSSINYLNGTNNPIHLVNDTVRNQINITISDTTGGSGGAAPKVSINGFNRSSFIGISANSTAGKGIIINGLNRTSFSGISANNTAGKGIIINGLNRTSFSGISANNTAGKGILINTLNRTAFTGIIANQTLAAPKIVINSNNRSSFISIANTTASNNINGHSVSFPSSNSGTLVLSNGTFSGNIDLKNTGTAKIGSGNLFIRNPASSFTYALTGTAIAANRTLNLPLQTQTETIAVQPQINFTAAANQTGTTGYTMLGPGVTLTPTVTARVEVSVSGYAATSVSGDGGAVQISRVTGSCPANAAVVTGTLLGSNIKMTGAATTSRTPFVITIQTTGLSTGQKYCFELTQQAITGGTFSIFNVMWSAKEL